MAWSLPFFPLKKTVFVLYQLRHYFSSTYFIFINHVSIRTFCFTRKDICFHQHTNLDILIIKWIKWDYRSTSILVLLGQVFINYTSSLKLRRGPQARGLHIYKLWKVYVFWWTCEWGPKSSFLPLCYVCLWLLSLSTFKA